MGILVRKDFSGGWWPSADAINAPTNVLLRMDNCTLDEQGIVALRLGSSKINSVALGSTDVHSLYSTLRSGSKVRYAGAVNSVFTGSTYGTDLGVTFAGTATDEIRFGSYLGQTFMARSTTKRKHDGTTVRNWGITAPSAPTVSAQSASTTTVATFNSTESPAFSASEGTITATFPTGEDGTANGSLELTPASATGRGTITKVFASDQNFSTIGGTAEHSADLFDLALYFAEPDKVQRVTVSFGFGEDAADYFNDGRYEFMFQLGGTRQQTNSIIATAMINAATQQVQSLAATAPPIPGEPAPSTANKRSREDVLERLQPANQGVYREVHEAATGNTGWTHVLCSRSQFSRVGSTSSRGWSTIRAFKVTFEGTAGSTGVVRFDNAILRGQAEDGMRIGAYKARVAYVYDSGGVYVERSGPSAESSTINLYGQKLRVTMTAPGGNWNTVDPQVNKIAVYIFGGVLDQYYEYSTLTAVPVGTGALDIDIADTDVELMIANTPLQLDNSVPPDNIVAIEGPHHFRMFVLDSSGLLHYSHRRKPGEFMTLHALRVGDGNETPYWLKRTNRGIYAGTSRDIYEVTGDGAELPDGTIDFKIEGLSVGSPPVDACVAAEGNTIFYRAADGMRLFDGSQSIPVPRAQVDLLWRGYTRHGVSPLNTTTGRFRAVVRAGVLTFIAPEGASTTSSATMHRADFTRNQWYRFTYPSAWRSVFVEPDGTVIAGDSSGFVRILDDKDASGADAGTGQAVEVWSKVEDDGLPLNKKSLGGGHMLLNTGGATATLAEHADGSDTPSGTRAPAVTGIGLYRWTPSSMSVVPRLYQWRLTVTCSTFALYEWAMQYVKFPRSRHAVTFGFRSPRLDRAFVREVRVMMCAKPSTTYTISLGGDGGLMTFNTIATSTTADTNPKVYTVPLGRQIRSTVYDVLIIPSGVLQGTTDTDIQVYWVELKFDETGTESEKHVIRYVPDEIENALV